VRPCLKNFYLPMKVFNVLDLHQNKKGIGE
jgi:hypothetical protein